ncbi:hypothetical protein [Streptomyces sp. NPDC050988]|uniref:hypothetical protein n=1 Tax=Streptomyces sp. NPDC050988 TaxID=3365637 RepID=UPI0037B1A584
MDIDVECLDLNNPRASLAVLLRQEQEIQDRLSTIRARMAAATSAPSPTASAC